MAATRATLVAGGDFGARAPLESIGSLPHAPDARGGGHCGVKAGPLKPALAHQRCGARILPAERSVGLRRVDRVARLEHVLGEARGDRAVVSAARFGEGLVGVRGERVGPELAVVTSGVTNALFA